MPARWLLLKIFHIQYIIEYSIDTPRCGVMAFVCKGVKYIEVNGLLDRLHTYFIPVQNFQIEI